MVQSEHDRNSKSSKKNTLDKIQNKDISLSHGKDLQTNFSQSTNQLWGRYGPKSS